MEKETTGTEPMRILRCEVCEKPCTLNTLGKTDFCHCPAGRESAEWKQVNKKAGQ
jgi:uncharacterized Fe-S radical SAM superfamily protein PflX